MVVVKENISDHLVEKRQSDYLQLVSWHNVRVEVHQQKIVVGDLQTESNNR